jgi:hypothetical protein
MESNQLRRLAFVEMAAHGFPCAPVELAQLAQTTPVA